MPLQSKWFKRIAIFWNTWQHATSFEVLEVDWMVLLRQTGQTSIPWPSRIDLGLHTYVYVVLTKWTVVRNPTNIKLISIWHYLISRFFRRLTLDKFWRQLGSWWRQKTMEIQPLNFIFFGLKFSACSSHLPHRFSLNHFLWWHHPPPLPCRRLTLFVCSAAHFRISSKKCAIMLWHIQDSVCDSVQHPDAFITGASAPQDPFLHNKMYKGTTIPCVLMQMAYMAIHQ